MYGPLDEISYMFGLVTDVLLPSFLLPPPQPAPAYPLIFTVVTQSEQPANPADVVNTLSLFNSSDPSTPLHSVTVSGLQEGERILGIDVRVANNQLYALGNYTLYTIDPISGAATAVGPLTGCPQEDFSGFETLSQWSFNFNPKTDTITIVTIASDNWEVNPDTGACTVYQNRYYDRASGAGYCGGDIAYSNNLPNLPADVNSTQYTISGWYIVVADPHQGACHIITQGDLDGPFDIYTTPDYENIPFTIRYNTLVTFDINTGENQTNVAVFAPLASGFDYAGLSTLPPGYNPLSSSTPAPTPDPTPAPTSQPTSGPTSSPNRCRVSVSFSKRTGSGGSWTSDGQKFQIYDITVTNTGRQAATGFTAYTPDLADVTQSWNYNPATGAFSNFGNSLAAGSSWAGAGFIYPVPAHGSGSFTKDVIVSAQC